MVDRFKDGIKWRNLVWMILTSRKFRSNLKGLIFYALVNYEEKRGDNAADVLLFDRYYGGKIVSSNS